MKYLLHLGIVACLVCDAFLFAQSPPSSTIRIYGYELSTRSQESKFAKEIPPTARVGGTRYEVETDEKGRTTRVAVMRNGKKLSERFYRFSPGAKLPDECEHFVAGEKTGVVRIQRDEIGNRTRENYFTVDGVLTHYEVYTYSPDHVEHAEYTPEGERKHYDIRYYSAKDTLTRNIYYSSPDDMKVETEFNDDTGLRKSRQQFNNGKFTNTVLYTYDVDDDLVRTDGYDGNHKWYVADEFTDRLRTRRIYLVGGATRELRYTYDEKRWLKESALYYKEVLVCRFVYDRLPDGTAKRTRALGPNGDLWAEYPDMEITDVKINGAPLAGKSVIHRTGNWWSPTHGPIEVLSATQGVDFGPYLQRILEEVRNNWYRLIPESAEMKKGKVAIEFAITRDGSIADMRLVTTSNDVVLDRAAWGGIYASNPFPTLPSEFTGPYLALRFHFYYNPDKLASNSMDKPTDIVVLPGQEVQLTAGRKQRFSVTIPGATDSTVIWSVWGPSCVAAACGSISADGIYTAPSTVPSNGTVSVMATLAADPNKTGSSTVDIQPSPSR